MALTIPSQARSRKLIRTGRATYVGTFGSAGADTTTKALLQLAPPANFEMLIKRVTLVNPGAAAAAVQALFYFRRVQAVVGAGTDVSAAVFGLDERDTPFNGSAQANVTAVGVGDTIKLSPCPVPAAVSTAYQQSAAFDAKDQDYCRIKPGWHARFDAYAIGGGGVVWTTAPTFEVEFALQPGT
jgi:hypothetical protein